MIEQIEKRGVAVSFWPTYIKFLIFFIVTSLGGATLALHFGWIKIINTNAPKANSSGNNSPTSITTGPNSPIYNSFSSEAEKQSNLFAKRSKGNKVQVTLKSICDDIDSRPLVQQNETEKQYVGMLVKRDLLRIHMVEVNMGDPNKYDLELTFPAEANSPDGGWLILCEVPKITYPQLRIIRKGDEVYISGEVKMMFRRMFAPQKCAELSNVTIEFE